MSMHNICFMDRGDSNEYAQHMFLWAESIVISTHNICFLWKIDENYPSIFIKYQPCLFY